ncbi:MAG: rubredoxin [Methanocorpusculum sp.]|nr:rubredoxin [Methanocorpusculum sp.]
MGKYVCSICGFVYDEEKGIPGAGIQPGTRWETLPDTWRCPTCGVPMADFTMYGAPVKKTAPVQTALAAADPPALSVIELSIICSNLAEGCRKQYLFEEEECFAELAEFYRMHAPPADNPSLEKLRGLVDDAIAVLYPAAKDAASAVNDRGALRALVWGEKAARMLGSVLSRYADEGEAMLKEGISVCPVCGFVYAGAEPPVICPVCSVPSWKFEKIEEG